jgi:hypothetical protein
MIAAVTAIIAFLPAYFVVPQEITGLVVAIFLMLLSMAAIIYIIMLHRDPAMRYGYIVKNLHSISHCFRDAIVRSSCNVNDGKSPTEIFESAIQEVLNISTDIFASISGKKCSCCIVSLSEDLKLSAITRDKWSEIERKDGDRKISGISIDENTPFEKLWHSMDDCSNAYICNDLPGEWLKKEYTDILLKDKKPNMLYGLECSRITRWPLPYKSIMVIPIRFTARDAVIPERNTDKGGRDHWGFLCIDSEAKKTFDHYFAFYTGCAIADALYVFFDSYAKLVPFWNCGAIGAESCTEIENAPRKNPAKCSELDKLFSGEFFKKHEAGRTPATE